MLRMRFTTLSCTKKDKATRRKGKLYNGEDHNLYFVTKYDEKIEDNGLQGISTCEMIRNAQDTAIEKYDKRIPRARLSCRWQNNIRLIATLT